MNLTTRTASDHDGDAKADPAVFGPATGMWYVENSSGPDVTQYWGMPGDNPVPGDYDYDGDGTTEYAVFRQASGTWYTQLSIGPHTVGHQGASGDVPPGLPYAVWSRYFNPAT